MWTLVQPSGVFCLCGITVPDKYDLIRPPMRLGKWDCGFATQGHTPHGRSYNSSLGYFFQINDYWTQGMVGSEGHGCPEAKVDLWLDAGPAKGLLFSAYCRVPATESGHRHRHA